MTSTSRRADISDDIQMDLFSSVGVERHYHRLERAMGRTHDDRCFSDWIATHPGVSRAERWKLAFGRRSAFRQ